MIIEVHNHYGEYIQIFRNIAKVTKTVFGFRLWAANGFYSDFNSNCTWREIK